MPNRKVIRQQPKRHGIIRTDVRLLLHHEVKEALKQIADVERKTLCYVVAEVVYAFFGLEVTREKVYVKNKNYHLVSTTGKKNTNQNRRKVAGKYFAQ